MDDFSAQKEEIQTRIVEAMISALEKQEVNPEEISTIAAFVLDEIDKATTQEELLQFLRDLSSKWTIFTPVLVIESGEARDEKEDQVTKDVLHLAKNNKLDEAIQLAKTMTQA